MTRPALRPNNQPAWRAWRLEDSKLHAPFFRTTADSSTFIAECRHGGAWPKRCRCGVYYMPTVDRIADLGSVEAEGPKQIGRGHALTLGFPIGQWTATPHALIDGERHAEGYRMWKMYVNAQTTAEARQALGARYQVPVVTGDASPEGRVQFETDARQMCRELSLSATTNTQNLRSIGSLAAGLSSLGGLQRLTARPR